MASNALKSQILNTPIDLNDKNRSSLIYAQGAFSLKSRQKMPARAKTTDGILRYGKYKIAGVIDSQCQQSPVSEILKINPPAGETGKKIPIFKTILEAKEKTKANTLIIGIAPEGGQLPNKFVNDLVWALEHKIDLVSGMHTPLCSFPQIAKAAVKNSRKIWETRIPPENLPLASCLSYEIKKPIVLTVGTDAAIGKLTTTYELARAAQKKGYRVKIIPTGQTAIMIEGWGITIDKCEGDFMAGAVEKMLLDAEKKDKPDIYFVEGQGSLFHPAYSTTALALIHGACPTHLVLVHRPLRKRITGCRLIPVPKLSEAIKLYEKSILPSFRNTKVVAIALNTLGYEEKQGREIIAETKKQTGLPTADLIRWGEDWTELFIN
ncbi:DUF1611 domain-containing protein [Patescibacteria group bacterium]|nr:DUF1611 domain-containing protein [Patescibacteria group bacterium]